MEKLRKLIISDEKTKIVYRNNIKTMINDILIKEKSKWISIYDINDLSNTQKIKIFFENWDELILPKWMIEKLSIYIKSQNKIEQIIWNNSSFNCLHFAHFINWVECNNSTFNDTSWNTERLKSIEINNLNIWDTILTWLTKKEWKIISSNSMHFSIYLWKWLFMWKWWDEWAVFIYDLEILEKSYPFKWLINYKITPKKED